MTTLTLTTLQKMKTDGEKITALTSYDATFTRELNNAGIELILVGDSLGMVVQGHNSTVPVDMQSMLYHTRCVAKANTHAVLMADLPFMSYATGDQALHNAAQLMQAGATIVKLEGGQWLTSTVAALTTRGIPVCAHLGLTPQSVHQLGGYRVQGKNQEAAQQLITDAQQLEQAGAKLLILECIPSTLAKQISHSLSIPVIGIGAGGDCDGQILVTHDLLGLGGNYRFVKNFLAIAPEPSITSALQTYRKQVKSGLFPQQEHSFS